MASKKMPQTKNAYFCGNPDGQALLLASARKSMDQFYLAPSLLLHIDWSPSMAPHLEKRFWPEPDSTPEGADRLQSELAEWKRIQADAYNHILQFFKIASALPVVGDRIAVASGKGFTPNLYIEARTLLSTDSGEMTVCYEVSIDGIDVLEEEYYDATRLKTTE
ncbi:hypothetical protein DNI29_03425 [Hymenobacter sediminis]|nr:hypothetical protein DNI29_03425 [Hymenobacter sediminis]